MKTKSSFLLDGNKKPVLPSTRDRAMIEFLWLHRVATFRTLHYLFYNSSSTRTCYNRLYKFRKNGFLCAYAQDGTQGKYFTLGPRGYAFLVKENGLDIGSKYSEPQSLRHDHLSSAILLGHWMKEKPVGVNINTEQMILSSSGNVAGFLKSDSRRPDGIWEFENELGKKNVALEVELHAKSEKEYVEIVKSYDNFYAIDKIIWVVKSLGLVQKIHSTVINYSTFKTKDHLYLLMSDVESMMWLAKFKNSSFKDKTLAELLGAYVSSSPKVTAGKSLGNCLDKSNPSATKEFITSALLDLSIPIVKSNTYKIGGKSSLPNSIPPL